MTRRQLLSAFAGASTVKAATVGRYLPPVDESVSDPTFLRFRASLLQICQTRDVSRLMPILGPGIRLDFGERNIGPQAFAKGWRLDRPGSSSLWHELETVLRLGCTKGKDENSFAAPYVFTRFPRDLDYAAHDVVIQKDLPLFAEMNEKLDPIELLHWDILERLSASRAGWVRVSAASGNEGFVRANGTRSPYEHRAIFSRLQERWMITSFIGGD